MVRPIISPTFQFHPPPNLPQSSFLLLHSNFILSLPMPPSSLILSCLPSSLLSRIIVSHPFSSSVTGSFAFMVVFSISANYTPCPKGCHIGSQDETQKDNFVLSRRATWLSFTNTWRFCLSSCLLFCVWMKSFSQEWR